MKQEKNDIPMHEEEKHETKPKVGTNYQGKD
jgi:hypothetical protein